MTKTFLFVKDINTNDVVSVYEYDEELFASQKALLDSILAEKRNLERLFPASRFLIEQASGEDVTSIAKMFPDIVGQSNINKLKIISPSISRYESSSYTYFIEDDGEDKIIEKHIIEGGTIPISLIQKQIGVIGGALDVRDFSNLELKASTPEPNAIKLTLLGRPGSNFYLAVNLWPPVEAGEKREFSFEYRWRGMWEPFRKEGYDQGSLDIGTVTTSLRINIVLPLETNAEMLREAEIGDIKVTIKENRKMLMWHVQNAPPGRYSYSLRKIA